MANPEKIFRAGVLSVVKHDYLPRAVAAHPRFELLVVADDADQPDWVHERNQRFADEFHVNQAGFRHLLSAPRLSKR